MIKLELDEAFCFDMLSIAQVKYERTRKDSALDTFLKIKNQIMCQIGHVATFSVLESDEYDFLYECNAKIFDLVDEIKRNPGLLASAVDEQNYRRFELKKALQEKFFPEKGLAEEKFGYKEEKE